MCGSCNGTSPVPNTGASIWYFNSIAFAGPDPELFHGKYTQGPCLFVALFLVPFYIAGMCMVLQEDRPAIAGWVKAV